MKLASFAVLLVLLLPSPSYAQTRGEPWKIIPTVTLLIEDRDERIELVHEGVAFWNKRFAEIGSSFHLGRAAHLYGSIPIGTLKQISERVRKGRRPPELSPSIRRWAGNIVVALSDRAFKSFTAHWPDQQKVLLGIRNMRGPFATPNVARNVIAHELGHAIGLGHNTEPGTLMCGPPAPCPSKAFASEKPRYFPLTNDEKARLKRMYPPD